VLGGRVLPSTINAPLSCGRARSLALRSVRDSNGYTGREPGCTRCVQQVRCLRGSAGWLCTVSLWNISVSVMCFWGAGSFQRLTGRASPCHRSKVGLLLGPSLQESLTTSRAAAPSRFPPCTGKALVLFFFPKAATPGVSLPHTPIAPLCFGVLVPCKPEQTGDSMYKDYTSVLWVTQVVPRRYVVLHLLGRDAGHVQA